MRYRIQIKAYTIQGAHAAAAVHGISLENAVKHPRYDEVSADAKLLSRGNSLVPEATVLITRLINWVCDTVEQAPYPEGTLLFYSNPEER